MVEVADRSANTLLPKIQTYIRPGTTVFSDEWRAYSQITSLGLSHSTVNHSINFIDPVSGAHTQTIESTWSFVKKMLRKQGVMNTSSSLFQTYLPEYLWRWKFIHLSKFMIILKSNTLFKYLEKKFSIFIYISPSKL